jgi:hypothetical protein
MPGLSWSHIVSTCLQTGFMFKICKHPKLKGVSLAFVGLLFRGAFSSGPCARQLLLPWRAQLHTKSCSVFTDGDVSIHILSVFTTVSHTTRSTRFVSMIPTDAAIFEGMNMNEHLRGQIRIPDGVPEPNIPRKKG